jgi:predicted N-acetyltransferase YhbS
LSPVKRNLAGIRYWAGGGEAISPADRTAVIDLCGAAFEDDFGRLFERRAGAGHLLAFLGDEVIGHLCWTYRTFTCGGGETFRVRWIEAVAVRLDWQGFGLGTRLMEQVAALPSTVSRMALMATRESFYTRLGWIQWEGEVVFEGWEETGEQTDEPLMVWAAEGIPDAVLDEDVHIDRRTRVDPVELLDSFLPLI